MKAFLSHSSKDKGLVSKVAEILGHGRCEYDEYTFEYVLNAQAIRRALHRSDLFVLFLSENSVNSNFVSEEVRTSLDLRASGKIKKVLIITLDNTSFRALPEWMQAINVIAKLASPQTCARKIEAELIALEAEQDVVESIYIPREEEAVKLRKVLSKPPGIAPVSVHAVGYPGVGRRTFLQKTLSNIYPRQIKTYARIRMSPYEGVNEFYRRLYDNFVVSSVDEKSANFEKFAESSLDDQVEVISDIIVQAMSHDEFILVEDDGGAYTDEGSYQPYISQIIQNLKGASRPFIGFSQTRMMPLKFKEEERSSYHIFISPLNSEKISELISFSLRDADIDFTTENLESLTSLIEGYPINVRLAVKAVESYGIEAFIADPSLLNDWKLKRAEDFISKIEFNNVEKDIIALLIDFHYLSFELIRKNMTNDIKEISEALRRLEDFCCIERRGTLYTIFAPIQSAASRDKRFKRNARWRGQVALNILDLVSDYTNDESVPVNILETAAKASIISGKYNGIAASFILPSHFLNLAQDAYADERWPDSLNFCKEAFKLKSRLSQDGLIELLRLWCITAIRINNPDEIEFALSELEKLKRFKVARRNIHFLRGFRLRLAKQYDAAEKQFIEAYKIAPKNMSINRELASLYRYRNEYSEAEIYARNAYEIRPTNAFVLDVLLETLLGKMSQGLAVDQHEIAYLFGELQKYGDVPGSSFYQTRIAQELFASNKKADALRAANIAVDRTPQFLPCYFLRAEIHISMNNVRAAKDDLKVINDILDKRGGFSEENEGRVVEIEIKILIEEENLRLARDRITRSQFLPRKTRQRLSKSLAKAISFSRKPLDSATIKWANEVLAKK